MNAQNAAQYLPFVKALAEGKKLEINLGNDEWVSTGADITFSNIPSNYRIVPETTRVITPGKWRMRNGEVVTIKELDGPHYQWASVDTAWHTWTADGKYTYAQIGNSPFDLISRVETKYRPWKSEEVVVGTVVKTKELGSRLLIVKITFNGRIVLGGDTSSISVENLHRDFINLDGTPCGVEEEVG